MAKAAQNNDQALNAFIGAKASIDQMLSELQAMSNDHFNTHPDEINWADVGNVSRIERRLKELLDMLKMEGEYSK
jgi:chaperonin cofactor prefoldin